MLELVTINHTIIILYTLFLKTKVLKLFGKNEWDDFKPLTCYFCLSIWTGFLFLPCLEFNEYINFLTLNFVIAYAVSKLNSI